MNGAKIIVKYRTKSAASDKDARGRDFKYWKTFFIYITPFSKNCSKTPGIHDFVNPKLLKGMAFEYASGKLVELSSGKVIPLSKVNVGFVPDLLMI